MKLLPILIIASVAFCSAFCFAEQEVPAISVKPIKELNLEELNFDRLSKESKVGNLAEFVKGLDSSIDYFLESIRVQPILRPANQGLGYVNGWLCHIAYYPQSIIYTVLGGPHYGLQTVTAHNGFIMYINYDYFLEYTPVGIILHHYYSDSEVMTGADQVITFR